jgi:FlaA1/EpsC-like NDP-sugar epimerase
VTFEVGQFNSSIPTYQSLNLNMLKNIKKFLVASPRLSKQALAVFSDVIICAIGVQLAMNLRLETHSSWGLQHTLLLFVGLAFFIPIFIGMGLYRAIFRYAGLQMIFSLNKAIAVYASLYAAVFTIIGLGEVPSSVGLLQPLIFGLGIVSSRLFVRYWLGGFGRTNLLGSTPRVLIYGAGTAGRQLAGGLLMSTDVKLVGFVDDDDSLHGHNINGLNIYSPHELALVVQSKQVTQIFLAIPSVSQRRRNEVINELLPLHVQVRTLPGLADLVSGKVTVSDLRELNIEDLLGREPVVPNPLMLAKNISGKVVMVTGAGGSIGSELCRQIIKAQPECLLLVELSEFALYEIHRELEVAVQAITLQAPENSMDLMSNAVPKLFPLLANVRDANRMEQILRTWRPSTIYHAAAYKHVPLVEHNPAEGVKNNMQGTLVTATLAELHGVSDFVLVSTDKAVRPTNIMGSTKRLAEMVLQAKAASQVLKFGEAPNKTRFSMVRFGNVLGSSGSVVPLFRKQIAEGGPLTLTDERMTRYFMTIPEAAQLVIQAAAMATGGDVFVLDMGQPVRILDLAKRMVELSGLVVLDANNPMGDIEIQVTGLRPGEKLYEELLIGDNPLPTSHPRIMKAHEEFLPWDELESKLNILNVALESNNVPVIRSFLKELVPGYQPEGDVVDWVWMESVKASA